MTEDYEEEDQRPTLRSLRQIVVDGLFDTFDYHLTSKDEPGNLMILYGDNGSGKTTILELLFHLISPSSSGGHRTFIAEVPFRRFAVGFSEGWAIAVERKTAVSGDYTLIFQGPRDELPVEMHFVAEKKTFTEGTDGAYVNFLRHLNLEVYFLRADRTLKSDSAAQARRVARNHSVHLNQLQWWGGDSNTFSLENDERHSLTFAVQKANDYLRKMSSRAVNVGGASANSIYEDVIRKVVHSARSLAPSEDSTKQVLDIRLRNLSERSKEYAQFRLAPPLIIEDMLETIYSATPQDLSIIANVLGPYLDSVTARLDALAETQKLVASLVEDVNSFFTNKRLKFSSGAGFQILNSKNKVLSLDMLSSGEKHLLLMFCHTVVAHGRRTIFIIDEPELSLNVKWQRRIADKLLDLVKDSPMQFIFATHSLELLSRQLDNTAKLESLES